jgi:hypothetical protein
MITDLPLRLVVLAPFVTRSSDSGVVGVDLPLARTAPQMKNAGDTNKAEKNGDVIDQPGKIMIPGSHVIGKLGAAMRELCALLGDDPLGEAFARDIKALRIGGDGKPLDIEDRASDGREDRRALTASDFVLATAEGHTGSRTRIAIDTVRSTVLDGMLQVVEQPFATGQRLEFKGHLRVVGPLDDERRRRLLKALQFVTQMGALRTIGYGQLVEVVVDGKAGATANVASAAKPPAAVNGNRLVVRLRFEDVFCTGEARNSPNTYSSAEYVPGGVIKGAIARQMLANIGRKGFLNDEHNAGAFSGDLELLSLNFERMRVRHAQPTAQGAKARPFRAIPDSLAVIDGDDGKPIILDLAGLNDPGAAVLVNGKVPVGPFDWKREHWAAANALLSIQDGPGRVLRVRTQISDDARAAMTSRLFGVEYTRGDTHDFLAEIDLSLCDDEPARIISGLQKVVANGLGGIGRGGAFARVALEEAPANATSVMGSRVVAVLQSAALLRDPSRPAVDLRTAYADAFAELGLPKTIRLTAVFVRERLAGGGFFRSRLLKGGRAYAPWLLTEPGATFVFESVDGSPIDPATLFPNGLDVPKSVLIHHGIEDVRDLYQVCPYIPENGYGDLVIDPFQIDGRPLWQARAPSALGLGVEPVDTLSVDGEG